MPNVTNVLVTAGATRNPIDAVRFLSARSSGRTGVYLAEYFAKNGGQVTFFGSPEACLRVNEPLQTVEYGSTYDLLKKMEDWVRKYPHGAVIHASAVGDYALAEGHSHKIPSGQAEMSLVLRPTPKIASRIRDWGLVGPLVTFKAASPEVSMEELIQIAMRQRERTKSDWVFANVLGHLEDVFAVVGESPHFFEAREQALEELARWVLTSNK